MQKISLLVILLTIVSCVHGPSSQKDEYLWLEDIEGKEALAWVEGQNHESQKQLTEVPRFKQAESDALKILEAKDKIPSGNFVNNKMIMNFWRDDQHVRGVLRRTSFENYKKAQISWETLLDVDALAAQEKENWVYQGIQCLEPAYELCLLRLSRGGKDASVVREYNLKTKTFVANGFVLSEAKSSVVWVDKDHLLVASDFGSETLTESGYPRQVRLWTRGTAYNSGQIIFEGQPKDLGMTPYSVKHRLKRWVIVSRGVDFFNSEEYIYQPSTQKLLRIPKPVGAELVGFFGDDFIFELHNPWNFSGTSYLPGAVISMADASAGRELQADDVQLLFTPKNNQSFSGLVSLKSKIALSILEDVQSQLLVTGKDKSGKWLPLSQLKLAGKGNIHLSSGTDEADLFLYYFESFNQPMTLYSYEFGKGGRKLKSLPDYFDAKNVQVEQKFAVSRDGTKVPYFLVYKSGMKFDGTAPTLQWGYGGFTISQIPSYNALVGKMWIERGGVYVVANIRGGGEYGPKWHQAALKENRQRAFDDFIAVSEDLIKNKVTSAQHLAISGRSNGGLLVGTVMTERPDLYGAVLCVVPLLDMMRYSQLLAGASWMSEYGDPKIPRYRKALLKYSPYQNVSADKTYPAVFFMSSTKDDRVHPGHARKMAAKMKAYGKEVLYYENVEGGHAGNANFKQLAKWNALQFEFLYQKIGDPQQQP